MLKNSFIYIIAEVINRGIPFLMLPLLTKYLAPYDYGIIASFSSFVAMITLLINFSIHGAINVNFFNYTKKELKQYIGNSLLVVGGMFVTALITIYFFNNELSKKILLDSEWLYFGVLIAVSNIITLVNLTLWIAQKKPKEYSLYQISQTILNVSMVIVFVVGYHYDWRGQLMATLIGSLSFGILSLYILHKRGYIAIRPNKRYLKEIINFGLPLIPHNLSGWLTTSGDRLLLITLIGATATGLFSVGYQIGMIMGVIVTAFHKAWNPYIYSKLSQKMTFEEKKTMVKYTYYYFIGLILLVFLLNEFSYIIFKYWIDDKFIDSFKYVIFILVQYAFNGMYFMVVAYIFFFKKTKGLALITFFSAVAHIILSYIFIKCFGAIGVAYSGVISYAIMFFSVWIYSNKIYPMPWFYWRNTL